MAKILKDIEMAEIISRAVEDKTVIEEYEAYRHFLEDLGELICTHFGGEPGRVSGPAYPGDELGWTCGFHINEGVPDDGGVFNRYDTDEAWRDGKEVQA
ncbi:hypothetical protein PDESU_00947 [Pontiella desulfatans]|uniref:Uncharacterized protein n=1 Tax=Pontiella desulfatans TaxID=2750659 RepID=A0A6C2TXN6_PONDE|nr:hypothetical protein [Pontiella desulfatans]VGO12395.1 hypothetical protein PDESU_00947 [Pontiella desulfatans]